MLHGTAAYLMTRLPEVGTLKPVVPDSDDIIDKGNDGASWLAGRDGSFWTIVIIAIVAAILVAAMKRPFVRGILLGVVLIAIVGAIMTK